MPAKWTVSTKKEKAGQTKMQDDVAYKKKKNGAFLPFVLWLCYSRKTFCIILLTWSWWWWWWEVYRIIFGGITLGGTHTAIFATTLQPPFSVVRIPLGYCQRETKKKLVYFLACVSEDQRIDILLGKDVDDEIVCRQMIFNLVMCISLFFSSSVG